MKWRVKIASKNTIQGKFRIDDDNDDGDWDEKKENSIELKWKKNR